MCSCEGAQGSDCDQSMLGATQSLVTDELFTLLLRGLPHVHLLSCPLVEDLWALRGAVKLALKCLYIRQGTT